MNYTQLVAELSNPKPIYENGELKSYKPPTGLELRAARAITALVEVVEGLTRSAGVPAEEVTPQQKESNESLDLQRPAS